MILKRVSALKWLMNSYFCERYFRAPVNFFDGESSDSIVSSMSWSSVSEYRMPSDRKFTADEIKELIGAPRLIRGESEEAYWKWWSAFVAAYNPASLLEWIQLNDYATKTWEQQRLQRSNSVVVEMAMVKALQNLLCHLESGRSLGLNALDREKISENYFFGTEKEKKRTVEEVEGWGVTGELIMAEAMRLRADSLVVFDKLDSYRAHAKRALLKDLDRSMEARRNSSVSAEAQP